MSSPLPLVILEEHNLALYVWWWAREAGRFDSRLPLIHFDAHTDGMLQHLEGTLYASARTLDKAERRAAFKDVVNDFVCIGAFIHPAICLGLVGDFYNLRPPWHPEYPRAPIKQRYVVGSHRGDGATFVGGAANVDLFDSLAAFDFIERVPVVSCQEEVFARFQGLAPDAVEYDFWDTLPTRVPVDERAILDIDLDYFSCRSNPPFRDTLTFEVTEDYYQRHKGNTQHPLRYAGLRHVVRRDGGKCLLTLKPFMFTVHDNLRSEAEILGLMGAVGEFAAKLEVPPAVITVSRSATSGYTPPAQVDFIQKELLRTLRANLRFPFETKAYEDL